MKPNSEVPQQRDSVDDMDELELPAMPSRWDDPPSRLSEAEFTRMALRESDDPLLKEISNALWAPVDLRESPTVQADRLKSIISDGAKLRERWAESAALEETFNAPAVPAVPPQVRMRQAKQRKLHEARARKVHRARSRAVLLASAMAVSFAVALSDVMGLVGNDRLLAFIQVTTPLVLMSANVLIDRSLSLSWRHRVVVRRLEKLRERCMKKPE
ncbi:hypothetical protein ACIPRD_16520 [Streptomyces sp. NPDC090108]|uniref:hypothetical protein n=1 Tax=Streptomyces sp. NPDC090108 TaxID=3365947 RepID=UPI003811D5E0